MPPRMDALRLARPLGWIAIALLCVAGTAGAQIPTEFTNLKILPKDIDRGELVGIMRDFASALGVRCIHCHVGEDPDSLEGVDFASDERQAKHTARAMMKMVKEINGSLLPETGEESPTQVRCVTCHRGLEHPETLKEVLSATIAKDGVESAVTEYRKLREQYYGQGSYDFSHRTLNNVADGLARGGELDAAFALLELSLEFEPDVARTHLMKGQIQAQKGDTAAARATVEKVLEMEPDNRFARRMLQRLTQAPPPSE